MNIRPDLTAYKTLVEQDSLIALIHKLEKVVAHHAKAVATHAAAYNAEIAGHVMAVELIQYEIDQIKQQAVID
jgi:hypothetical protein